MTSKCGTYAGHARHRYLREAPCDLCRKAANKYRRERYAKKHPPEMRGPSKRTMKPIPHGTEPGYGAHRRRGEEACEACKKAKSEYTWARKKAQMEADDRPRRPKGKIVRVPIKLFAELYWTASMSAVDGLLDRFGDKKIEEYLKLADQEEE